MSRTREVVTAALEKRAQANIKVRQPLASLTTSAVLAEEFAQIVKDEVNVKEVMTDESADELAQLDTEITPELKEEGELRELVRTIQDARKEAGLAPGEAAKGTISGISETLALAEKFKDEIQKQTQVEIAAGGEQEATAVSITK